VHNGHYMEAASAMFCEHRKKLRNALNSKNPIIITGYTSMQLAGDMAVPFIQQADFFWLTGISEPGWQLLLLEEEYLVRPYISPSELLFDGGMLDHEAAKVSGVHTIITADVAKNLLKDQQKAGITKVYAGGYDAPYLKDSFTINPAAVIAQRTLKRKFQNVEDIRPLLVRLRATKDENEHAYIRKAIAITTKGFNSVRDTLADLVQYEYEVEASLGYTFRMNGAEGYAYEPIVAAGANALTLHYTRNNNPLPKNGLLLIDAAARVGGYCADITRTYAIGTPTAREVAVHAAVEKAHFAIINLIKPGLALSEYQDKSDEIMKEALRSLGLLKKPEDYRKYFPHAISHGLGIDVHESFGGYTEFMPGMVLTVEPGIYIPEEGIGVRIEDDILVTETGNENLSGDLPTGL